ncbi:glycerophosphodiester phosphodiesterase [Bowmanella denitrificans]|uniref:Glycerophosphodiester phosphodiesterase n=1 Tax=Bowmanella denitrificans TaxID=366582 RepID=A0ABN0XWT0_9ALTE
MSQPIMLKALLWLSGFALAYLGLTLIPAVNNVPPHTYYQQQGFETIAHGAGQGLRPKNTLEAALNAWQLGADVIEMDIHASADNQLVARHDDTVNATTNGQGYIRDMTLAQLKTLDAGYYHQQGGIYPFRDQHVQIPALAEVFSALPNARFMLEIKPDTPTDSDLLCQLIKLHGRSQQVLVTSFHTEALLAFRQACPDVATSMTKKEITWFVLLHKIGLSHLYPLKGVAMQVPEYSGPIKIVTPALIRALNNRGARLQVWTINDEAAMRRFLDYGVNGIITDFPDRLMTLVTTAK